MGCTGVGELGLASLAWRRDEDCAEEGVGCAAGVEAAVYVLRGGDGWLD